jgi:hypothetical protein
MTENFGVRIGTAADVHPMMELAMKACDENGFVNPNPKKLLADIWPALNLDNGLVGIIEDDNGPIEGAVLLRIGTMWYSDTPVLEEKAIFIHPDYRSAKGGRARRLCEFSKKTADTLEMPLIIGVLSNHRTEAKVRLYERQFGRPSGAFFLYNAKTGAYRTAAE